MIITLIDAIKYTFGFNGYIDNLNNLTEINYREKI